MLLSTNSVVAYRNTRQLDEDARWVSHTYEVLEALADARDSLRSVQTATLDNKQLINPVRLATAEKIARVEWLTVDNSRQQTRIPRLKELAVAYHAFQADAGGMIRRDEFSEARNTVKLAVGKRILEDIASLIHEMEDEENRLLRERETAHGRAYHKAVVSGVVGYAVGLLALAIAFVIGWHWFRERGRIAFVRDRYEFLESTISSLGDGMIVTDLDGRILVINSVAEKLTGWFAWDALGRTVEEVFHTGDPVARRTVRNPLREALAGGNPVQVSKGIVLHSRHGAEWMIDDSAAPIRDGGGKLAGAVLLFKEIGDRVRTERALAEASRNLESANTLLMGQATMDALTGVGNRHAFDIKLAEEFAKAVRNTHALSVILMDVDHFKGFNDTFGHPAGDAALKSVAELLQNAARGTDFVARYGGEEFVAILQHTDRDGAMAVAERFRRAIATADWDRRLITVSIGVTTLSASTADAASLVQEADEALYRSKNAGRNRVEHRLGIH